MKRDMILVAVSERSEKYQLGWIFSTLRIMECCVQFDLIKEQFWIALLQFSFWFSTPGSHNPCSGLPYLTFYFILDRLPRLIKKKITLYCLGFLITIYKRQQWFVSLMKFAFSLRKLLNTPCLSWFQL